MERERGGSAGESGKKGGRLLEVPQGAEEKSSLPTAGKKEPARGNLESEGDEEGVMKGSISTWSIFGEREVQTGNSAQEKTAALHEKRGGEFHKRRRKAGAYRGDLTNQKKKRAVGSKGSVRRGISPKLVQPLPKVPGSLVNRGNIDRTEGTGGGR